MKIRLSFVSNSSTSSFIITNWINVPVEIQNLIINPPICSCDVEDKWVYKIKPDNTASFFTIMDNFDLISWADDLIKEHSLPCSIIVLE